MAFDRHMNLVLGDAEEFRILPPKKGISEEDVSFSLRTSLEKFAIWDAMIPREAMPWHEAS